MSRLIFASNQTLHAPHLIDLEVAQVLRRYVRNSVISPERGAEALADMSEFPITRHPHFVLFPRMWQLRHVLTAYYASYLVLAEALSATLVTRDRALARSGAGVQVEVI